jgi:TonB family protein
MSTSVAGCCTPQPCMFVSRHDTQKFTDRRVLSRRSTPRLPLTTSRRGTILPIQLATIHTRALFVARIIRGRSTAHVTTGCLVVALVTCLSLASALAAQDTLARAKALYADAVYEEALAILDRLTTSADPAEVAEVGGYRVFCLLALGRNDEARRAIEALVKTSPLYRPSDTTASPKTRAVFDDVRRRLLPAVAQEQYAKAKATFDAKQYEQAGRQFDDVIRLLDDPALSDWAGTSDLHTLATGFRDLSHQNADAAVRAAAPPPVPPLPPAKRTPRIYTSDDPTVTKPVPVSKAMPVWRPPNAVVARQEFRGLLELTIDETGAVTSAVLRKSVHPAYDPVLLRAARTWKFKPAMKEGAPVRFLDFLEVRLRPPDQEQS